jgi:hypothetical protein
MNNNVHTSHVSETDYQAFSPGRISLSFAQLVLSGSESTVIDSTMTGPVIVFGQSDLIYTVQI